MLRTVSGRSSSVFQRPRAGRRRRGRHFVLRRDGGRRRWGQRGSSRRLSAIIRMRRKLLIMMRRVIRLGLLLLLLLSDSREMIDRTAAERRRFADGIVKVAYVVEVVGYQGERNGMVGSRLKVSVADDRRSEGGRNGLIGRRKGGDGGRRRISAGHRLESRGNRLIRQRMRRRGRPWNVIRLHVRRIAGSLSGVVAVSSVAVGEQWRLGQQVVHLRR